MFNDLLVRLNYRKLWLVSCLMVNEEPCEFIYFYVVIVVVVYTDIRISCKPLPILGFCRTRFFSFLAAVIFLDELERLTRTWR